MKVGTPRDDELEELARGIAHNWANLGRCLGFEDSELVATDEENEEIWEKGYQMLMHWKQNRGVAATYKALHDALQHEVVQRQDLAESICQGGRTMVIIIIFSYIKRMCSGPMVLNALVSGLSSLGLSPGKVIELTLLCAICSMFTLN